MAKRKSKRQAEPPRDDQPESPIWKATIDHGRFQETIYVVDPSCAPEGAVVQRVNPTIEDVLQEADQAIAAAGADPADEDIMLATHANPNVRTARDLRLLAGLAMRNREVDQETSQWSLDCLAQAREDLIAMQRTSPAIRDAVFLGDGKCRIGTEHLTLTPSEAAVLESLVDSQTLSEPELINNSGYRSAPRILLRLVSKHKSLATCIRLPGKKGGGGYSTTMKHS